MRLLRLLVVPIARGCDCRGFRPLVLPIRPLRSFAGESVVGYAELDPVGGFPSNAGSPVFPADGIKRMDPPDGLEASAPHLTADHRMLLRMRETLYEGVWADFVRDLEARLANEPYVFETVAPSAEVRGTIEAHLRMIREMSEWEGSTGLRLEARSSDG